jgi:hypothetical protein
VREREREREERSREVVRDTTFGGRKKERIYISGHYWPIVPAPDDR